jgi:hypothetical protein
MFQSHFYHSTLKTSIKIFGKLFSNLFIKRGTTLVPVPVNYSSKDKSIQKYQSWLEGTIEDQQNVVLPRMGFIMGDPQVDKNKQLNRLHRIFPKGPNKTPSSFNSIPFTVPFQLSIMTKNLDDMLQIVEQIVPFFYPEFSITITDNPVLEIETDYIYKIDSISQDQDTWDGTFDDRRLIVWTISFTCELNMYHPIVDSKLIKKIILDGFTDDEMELPIFKETIEVSPFDANATDPYEIVETLDEY